MSARLNRSTGRWPAPTPGSPACAVTSPRIERGMGIVEVDAERGLLKLNPLLDWTAQAVLDFVQEQ